MSFIAAAGIAGGGAVIGGVLQANAAENAADTQAAAGRYAVNTQRDMYNQQRADQEPWRQAGVQALGQMQNPDFQRDFTMADFQADPGYAFRMAEGQKAIERAAAARGNMGSGATLQSLSKYNQGMASDEYNNAYNRFNTDRNTRFNRLASMAGTGQTAVSQVGAAGQNTANQIGQTLTGIGNAQAAGQIGQANAIGGAIGQSTNNWMQYQMMNRMFPQAVAPNTAAPAIVPGGSTGGGYGSYGNIA